VDYIIFSLNSIDAQTHDGHKGIKGLHEKVVSAIKYIREKNKKIRICAALIITNDNYKTLNDFVHWALDIGADVINFLPVLSGFGQNARDYGLPAAPPSNPLLRIDDLQELDRQIDLLISKKKKGFPIATPFYALKTFKIYYRTPGNLPRRHCHIGFRNVHILANGNVKLCYFFPPVGNIKDKNIKEIWFSEKAEQQRKEILSCSIPCASAALREYRFIDKLYIFLIRSGITFRKRRRSESASDAGG
jgi:MoaA/NifB/PqqE/SkfB family radical SAM enzyme